MAQRAFSWKWLLAAGSILLLAGCSTDASLRELRHTMPKGNPFQIGLTRLYLAFSESEATQYDWHASKYFADKGLLAAYGHDVPPEILENWDLPKSQLPELQQARAALLTALSPENISNKPGESARAQFFFDCWVEQQEENWQENDINACRDAFYTMLQELQPAEQEQDENVGEAEAPTPVVSTSYIIFFEWNQSKLSNEGLKTLDSVVSDVEAAGSYELVLNGHSDRSGSDEYNLELSQKRVEIVKNSLLERGILAEKMQVFAFGESDPRVPTSDGIKERANRRVEIFINDE